MPAHIVETRGNKVIYEEQYIERILHKYPDGDKRTTKTKWHSVFTVAIKMEKTKLDKAGNPIVVSQWYVPQYRRPTIEQAREKL